MYRVGESPGLELFNGDAVDISKYTDLKLYYFIWYWDNPYAINNPYIGIWSGISHIFG